MILPRQGSFRELGPTLGPLGQAPIGSQSCLQQLYVATGGRPVGPRRARITRPHSSLPRSTRHGGPRAAPGTRQAAVGRSIVRLGTIYGHSSMPVEA